jgi:D-alanine-D-alanine ligase
MTPIVLFGGSSDERHVSVASAQSVLRTLDDASVLAWFWAPEGAIHDVSAADLFAHQRPFENDYIPSRPAIFPTLEQALDTMPVEDPVFFLAVHGTGAEDGVLQRMLEKRGLPFTGSGSEASAKAFDKDVAKATVRGRVRLAESRIATTSGDLSVAVDDLLSRHDRVVLKPQAGGSSRGVFFLGRDEDRQSVVAEVAKARIPYIVEQFIHGREVACGVVDQGEGPFALPVIEVEVDPGHAFDYAGKYLGKGTREICPANIPDDLARAAQETALAAHVALGCEGYSRSDIMLADGGAWFLETNTLPGLTVSSLLPQELRAQGIGFRDFLLQQLELAGRRAVSS